MKMHKLTMPAEGAAGIRKAMPSDEELLKRGLAAHLRHMPGIGEPTFDTSRAANDMQMVEFDIAIAGEKIRVKRGDRVISIAGISLPTDELPREVRRELEPALAQLDGASFDVDSNLAGVQEARRAISAAIVAVMGDAAFRNRLITAGRRRAKKEE
jgi:hypothetical protein